MNQKRIIAAAVVLLTCAAAAIFFVVLYRYDNKYTIRSTVSQEGVTLLSSSLSGDLDRDVVWLVEGWEFYPDLLADPGDALSDAVPMYIGQYFSFSLFHEDGSPYGVGTYRLILDGKGTYSILLPEVFCACRVYKDGSLIASSGSVAPYVPQVKDLVFTVTLDGETELWIQTANDTHYYSGITYPPAIGSSEAISRLITYRMLFYGFLAFTSLALAVFASAVWIGTKRSRVSGENFWLGILALSFFLRLCYPFVHALGLPFFQLFYILEDVMAALGLFCIVRTTGLICLKRDSILFRILTGVTLGFLAVSLLFPGVIMRFLPQFAPVYGQILYWYKVGAAVTMTGLLCVSIWRHKAARLSLLLAGLLFYAVALLSHAFCLGHYEPARFGWFEEWGTYGLIFCFTVRMVIKNMEIVRENQRLNTHLQEEVDQKTASLTQLLEERRMLLSGFAHDLKTPLTSITTFTRLVEMDGDHLDEESRQYLDVIRKKTGEIKQQLEMLHEFTYADRSSSAFGNLDLCSLAAEFFEENQPDMEVNGLKFSLSLPKPPHVMVRGDRQKLKSVLQNLVYNAVSFTPEGGTIALTLRQEENACVLSVRDTGAGIPKEDLSHLFDRFFTRRELGEGLGLFIAKSVVTEHNGTIEVDSELGKGTVFTVRLPLAEKNGTERKTLA